MKIKTLLLIVFLSFHSLLLLAGNENFPIGGREAGVSNASVCFSDVWAVHYNQAGLAYLKDISVGIYYDNRFMVNNMSMKAAAIALPTKNLGVFGISLGYFGYSLYNEQKIGLAYARTFGKKFSAGVQLDYLGVHIGEDYGAKNNFAAEAGIQYEIIKNLKMGAHIYNLNRAIISGYNNERIPTIMKLGLSYNFSEKVLVSAESEKDVEFSPIFKAGIEYHMLKMIFLRLGVSTNPAKNTFGLGLDLKGIKFDFAFSRHDALGWTPMVSMVYDFNKK